MVVDEPPSAKKRPSVALFLGYCANYPVSPSSLRVAIRKVFVDAEDLNILLGVIDQWLDSWLGRNIDASFSAQKLRTENGVPVAKKAGKRKIAQKAILPEIEPVRPVIYHLSFLHANHYYRFPCSFKRFWTHPL